MITEKSQIHIEILLTILPDRVISLTPDQARELFRLLSDLFKIDPAFTPPGTWVSHGFSSVSK